MVEIIKPEQRETVSQFALEETCNRLIFTALRHHLGELFSAEYVQELKANEDLQKRTIEGKTYFILRDKVILWIEYPTGKPINGSGCQELKYKFFE